MLPSEISEALARGATVLTSNQRAARTLRQQADFDRHAAGLTTWEPPAILAWDTWMASLWRDLLLEGKATELLLNPAQEHTLWLGIIAADPEWRSLLPPDSLAELAADAWSRLWSHGGEDRLRGSANSVDTRAFARWAQAFDYRCRGDGFLPRAQLASVLAAKSSVRLSAGGYLLVGFDRMTPAQQALIVAIGHRGIAIAETHLSGAGDAQLSEATDEQEELLAAAGYLRRHLEAQPGARIALIVPGLAARRAEIDRVLRQTLAPERNIITDHAPPLFEFSLGIPLDHTAPVETALTILHWAVAPLAIGRISQLLLSPHFAGGNDVMGRAAFDASTLRRHHPLRPELSIEGLLRLTESSKYQVPEVAAVLRTLRRVIAADPLGETRSYADWADTFRALLTAAGWGRELDSVGFQAFRRWEGVLDELATLDFTGVRTTYGEAVAAIARLAGRTLFAPETRGAPVQVMEPLESAGSTFDAAWFLGAGDATWPQRPGTSPLLSWHLQRDLKMPGTDAALDLAHARRTAERVAGSAADVTFSYSRELAEGHQRPSAALTGLRLKDAEGAVVAASFQPLALERIDDLATLPPLPDEVLLGGAEILKHQAACGFRAFAEHRLFARVLGAVEPGMDARDRGKVVHEVLQAFWKGVQSQDELRSLTIDVRRGRLTAAIEAALLRTAAANSGAWSAAYLDVQCERLLSVLDEWLLKELDRKVPFVVRDEELELNDVRIGPLRLTLRVDRIDETEFGDVILDYKTGEARPADWLTERPDEPQLPLYAVLAASAERPLAGVAFANIRAGKDMAMQGYETQKDILLRSSKLQTASLDAQVDAWRETLTALATDFHQGDPRVRPKSYPHTCQYCEQRLLCRLDLTLLHAPDDEHEDAEGVDG